mgnify:CR=1 FL=1
MRSAAPGMNAAIRAAATVALQKGHEVLGVERGYKGLLAGALLGLVPTVRYPEAIVGVTVAVWLLWQVRPVVRVWPAVLGAAADARAALADLAGPQARALVADARAVESAGAFGVLLELVVPEVAAEITAGTSSGCATGVSFNGVMPGAFTAPRSTSSCSKLANPRPSAGFDIRDPNRST